MFCRGIRQYHPRAKTFTPRRRCKPINITAYLSAADADLRPLLRYHRRRTVLNKLIIRFPEERVTLTTNEWNNVCGQMIQRTVKLHARMTEGQAVWPGGGYLTANYLERNEWSWGDWRRSHLLSSSPRSRSSWIIFEQQRRRHLEAQIATSSRVVVVKFVSSVDRIISVMTVAISAAQRRCHRDDRRISARLVKRNGTWLSRIV